MQAIGESERLAEADPVSGDITKQLRNKDPYGSGEYSTR